MNEPEGFKGGGGGESGWFGQVVFEGSVLAGTWG